MYDEVNASAVFFVLNESISYLHLDIRLLKSLKTFYGVRIKRIKPTAVLHRKKLTAMYVLSLST